VLVVACPLRAGPGLPTALLAAAPSWASWSSPRSTADELLAVSSPITSHAVLTERGGADRRAEVGELSIPAHGILAPFGDDIVLQDPSRYETLPNVPLALAFAHGAAPFDQPCHY
jgi:hypothetical protein